MKKMLVLPILYLTGILLFLLNLPPVQAGQPAGSQTHISAAIRPEIASAVKSEQIRELISPDQISTDQGASYIARLTIPRIADRESTSTCILLENGTPLLHPHALHKRIRDEGRGHYSHWTPNTLYFSASDSSDPRTNGKKYELVNTEAYVEKQASFLIKSPHSVIEFPSISKRRIQPTKLIWQNLDPQSKVSPAWKRKGTPDLTSQETMLASILKPGMQEEEKALAIWKFLIDWRYHFTPPEQGDELHDPVKFLNVYGYGFCDDCATNFAVLARKAGLKSRVWGLSGHVVAEAFYDGQWHMFDPDHEVIYRNERAVIAGVEELSQHPELITKTPQDPIGSPSQSIADLYTSTNDNRVSERQPVINDTVLAPVLEPLDQVEFRFSHAEYVHQKPSVDSAKPPVAGNGTLKRTSPFLQNLKQTGPHQREWHLKWPYVFLKGTLNLKLKSTETPPLIFVSSDKKSWQKLDGDFTKHQLRVSLDRWLQNQPTAVYECFVRLENPDKTDPANSIKQLDAEVIFQFAPRALAHMENRNNTFEMKLTPVPHLKEKGVKVQLFWKEVE
tara:strand:+ start:8793 stop:10475 length:1683 start_codon:yes stop_codon:yes gene_type:complete